jgi:hypothetical protein
MPHVSDVRSTSHDRHDPMLVAALAADDLAGTDRDQAIALTSSCVDCATLHDDLLALARETASAPPPMTARPRDFRLTPADAARLRPSGWRRLVAAVASSRRIISQPLGVGLATLGLVGLLIGNVQLGFGSSSGAAAPALVPAAGGAAVGGAAAVPAASAAASTREITNQDSATDRSGRSNDLVAAPIPGASSAAASSAPVRGTGNFGAATGSGLPSQIQPAPLAVTPGKAAPSDAAPAETALALESAAGQALRPLNVLFGLAVVAGIGLLVAARLRSRRTV